MLARRRQLLDRLGFVVVLFHHETDLAHRILLAPLDLAFLLVLHLFDCLLVVLERLLEVHLVLIIVVSPSPSPSVAAASTAPAPAATTTTLFVVVLLSKLVIVVIDCLKLGAFVKH